MHRTAFLLLALLAVGAVSSACADAAPRKTSVVGGMPIPIESAPYQVFLRIGTDMGCGGSVLDPRTVLTAAHCVVPPGQTVPRPPEQLTVLAGFTDTTSAPPPGSQTVGVAAVRTHPFYEEATKTDDVAVLTLATALSLSGPNIKPIALAPVGGGAAPGAAFGFSGYGAQVEGRLPDGKLYAATLTAITDDQCRPNIAVNASASVQCVAGAAQGACFGDSGGPLTSGGVQVAIASYAPQAGCARGPSGFADVTAPEVRAFIDGAATIPVAPRQSEPALLFSINPPVHGSPMRCDPGIWANGPTLGYTFVNDATGAVLQSGPSPRFVPSAAHRGAPIACVVAAANAGGTSTARTGTTAAVQPDLVPPNSALLSVRCRKRRCTVRLRAADRNSQGALRIRVTARGRRFNVKHVKGAIYRARSGRLRRGTTKVRIRVRDAVGNRRKPDITRRVRVR